MFGELRLVRAMTDAQVEIMRDPKRAPFANLPKIDDASPMVAPDRLVSRSHRHLKKLEAAYPGLDHISVSLSVGVPKAEALEQLERFAKEVIPAFRNVKVEAKAEQRWQSNIPFSS